MQWKCLALWPEMNIPIFTFLIKYKKLLWPDVGPKFWNLEREEDQLFLPRHGEMCAQQNFWEKEEEGQVQEDLLWCQCNGILLYTILRGINLPGLPAPVSELRRLLVKIVSSN